MCVISGGETDLTLSSCLSFFSGAERLPPIGFETDCALNFNRDNIYPTASTCALTLVLPTKYHDDYIQFKDKMLFGFANHGGFGLC